MTQTESRKSGTQPLSCCIDNSQDVAKRIRVQAARMIYRARSSHLGSSFSMAELLAVLYTKTLRIDPNRPDWAERDRFVLSKGHACAALYAVLAHVRH